ncbi:F0F1 ATP synthase subunit epsilon [Endozoicomonas gorgoniicola]|uniref:ATP synthase epsilon chain n=1 Tax=Endozoicomonas gorgoniicola TaxID=1234144 RepID=A0ABT3N196_9GAMM|nr:F0F1 ATP synthase subunit epsilon [Endozoicomonas gorgoniicola]MCW7555408.1 F0F1 ATP synthase subunit epsilon [Endozoicomonas gorgoniicola]
MANTVHCDIVSAEEEIFSGQVEMVVATGSLGDLGITPGHTPLLTELSPGPIRLIAEGGEEEVFYISGGFLEVQPSQVKVLADTALRADDMDEAAAAEAKKLAEQELTNQSGEFDYSRAATQLAEAAAQLRTLQAIRKKLGK